MNSVAIEKHPKLPHEPQAETLQLLMHWAASRWMITIQITDAHQKCTANDIV